MGNSTRAFPVDNSDVAEVLDIIEVWLGFRILILLVTSGRVIGEIGAVIRFQVFPDESDDETPVLSTKHLSSLVGNSVP